MATAFLSFTLGRVCRADSGLGARRSLNKFFEADTRRDGNHSGLLKPPFGASSRWMIPDQHVTADEGEPNGRKNPVGQLTPMNALNLVKMFWIEEPP